jgi:hypothetical protein
METSSNHEAAIVPTFQHGSATLYQGDCIESMRALGAGSIDLIVRPSEGMPTIADGRSATVSVRLRQQSPQAQRILQNSWEHIFARQRFSTQSPIEHPRPHCCCLATLGERPKKDRKMKTTGNTQESASVFLLGRGIMREPRAVNSSRTHHGFEVVLDV